MTVTIASDTFTRANQSGWGTASDGNTWNHATGSGTLSIASNKGHYTGDANNANMVLLGNAWGGTVNAVFRAKMSNAASDLVGLVIRDDGTNKVQVIYHNGVLNALVDGVSVASTSVAVSSNTLYWLRLVASGTSYQVRFWPDAQAEPAALWNLTFTDTVAGNGQVGVYLLAFNVSDTIDIDSFSVVATPQDYYVSTTGNDSTGNGTQSNPWLTLAYAGKRVGAGDTVHVLSGTYTSPSTLNAYGMSGGLITYKSETRWGAKLATSWASSATPIRCNGDYSQIIGFEISGGTVRIPITLFGSYSLIQYNYIHDINPPCDNTGSGGIVDDGSTSNNTIDSNIVARFGNYPTACDFTQGIYPHGSNDVITNNIVYNTSGAGLAANHNTAPMTFANNLSFANAEYGLTLNGSASIDNYIVSNNIFVANLLPAINVHSIANGTHNQFLNNIVFSNGGTSLYTVDASPATPNGTITGTITSDPLFVNFQSDGSGDYHLQLTSPGIDGGTSTGAPASSYDGVARPQRNGFDIGPYELPGSYNVVHRVRNGKAVHRVREGNTE